MKKIISKLWFAGAIILCVLQTDMMVEAKQEPVIKDGVYAGDISLAGKTAVEAENAIAQYVEGLKETELLLTTVDNQTVSVKAMDMGIQWSNPEMVEEAVELGTHGNIIQRYKVLKDLAHESMVFKIELDFDIAAINQILIEKCTAYDREAVNYSLWRQDGVFSLVEGQKGYSLDVEASTDTVYDVLVSAESLEGCNIPLVIVEQEPMGSAEELAQVNDLIGSYTTSFATSNSNRQANLKNGCSFANGVTLYPGEEFSSIEELGPFTAKNGYFPAGTYLNGKVVDGLAGGICQVTTTLYNAVLMAELEVSMRYNHSMAVSYVDPGEDAAIASSAGKDFKFINNTEYPIYIEGFTTQDKKNTFNIYGVETRDTSRKVEYISEVIEVMKPDVEKIYIDASQPIGYIEVDGAHTGYKAKLWKVVQEDGVEVSREQVNSSSYKMVPRSATVGVATSDANAYNEIMAAIGTSNIDHVKNVIGILTAPPAAPTEPATP